MIYHFLASGRYSDLVLLVQRKEGQKQLKQQLGAELEKNQKLIQMPNHRPSSVQTFFGRWERKTWVRLVGQSSPGFSLSMTRDCWAFGLSKPLTTLVWNSQLQAKHSLSKEQPWLWFMACASEACPGGLDAKHCIFMIYWSRLRLGLRREVQGGKNNSKCSTSDHWTSLK